MLPTADKPFGFSHLNSIAAAAASLLEAEGEKASRITILDIDVHHGNGSEDTFWNDSRVQTISLHENLIWPQTGNPEFVGGDGARGTNLNVPIPVGGRDGDWKYAMEEYILGGVFLYGVH